MRADRLLAITVKCIQAWWVRRLETDSNSQTWCRRTVNNGQRLTAGWSQTKKKKKKTNLLVLLVKMVSPSSERLLTVSAQSDQTLSFIAVGAQAETNPWYSDRSELRCEMEGRVNCAKLCNFPGAWKTCRSGLHIKHTETQHFQRWNKQMVYFSKSSPTALAVLNLDLNAFVNS